MSGIIYKLNIELSPEQIADISEFWEEYGTPGGAMILAQPTWGTERGNVIKFAVVKPKTAEAIKQVLDTKEAP